MGHNKGGHVGKSPEVGYPFLHILQGRLGVGPETFWKSVCSDQVHLLKIC